MKNKKLLVALSKLLKLDETVFTEALDKEDGDESLLKTYTDKHQAYTLDELSTLIKNANKTYLEKADFEINEVPQNLYKKIAGASLESKEKALAKEFGIEKYEGLQDLIAKAVESKTGKGVDELSKQQIETLKATLASVEQEKQSAIEKLKNEYNSEFINRDFTSALSSLNLKAEKEVLENKRKLLSSAFTSEFKLGRKNNLTVVLDKEGKPVVDKLGEPEKISNVLTSFAKGYGFEFTEEQAGGRGTNGSDPKPSLKGLSFSKVLEAKGIKPNTNESDEAYKEWAVANQ